MAWFRCLASSTGVLLGLVVLAPTGYGAEDVSAPDVGHEIAKIPQAQSTIPPGPVPGSRDVPDRDGDGLSERAAPEGSAEVALLTDPAPRLGTAADLIERALECGWNGDSLQAKGYLSAAATSAQGGKDRAHALILLAKAHYEALEPAEGDAVIAQVMAEYADPELQASADVVQQFSRAMVEKRFDFAEDLLVRAAEDWDGTELGGWAALQLGNLYRDWVEDFGRAIPFYEAAMDAYPGTMIAEEAGVSIGECLLWSGEGLGEAVELFSAALESTDNPRLRARGLSGCGDALGQTGEYTAAVDVLSELIESCPDHPGVPVARACRSASAARMGLWEMAAEDARAFLGSLPAQQGNPWVRHCETVLGQEAFRAGDYVAALARFERALAGASGSSGQAQALAGMAASHVELGQFSEAISAFLEASDRVSSSVGKCFCLHQAVQVADQAEDRESAAQIVDRMAAEFPGSYLTTRLVGHEVLPPPEIWGRD